MMNEAQFPGVPQSVVSARRFVTDSLSGIPIEISETVALIASELASNSVRHAASAFEVRVEQLPHEIHIEVEDDGDGEPTVRTPGPNETSGRGLQIVTALADEWGVVPKPEATGKTVWVKIAVRTTGAAAGASESDGAPVAPKSKSTKRRTGTSGSQTTVSPAARAGDLVFFGPGLCTRTGRPLARHRLPGRCALGRAPARV